MQDVGWQPGAGMQDVVESLGRVLSFAFFRNMTINARAIINAIIIARTWLFPRENLTPFMALIRETLLKTFLMAKIYKDAKFPIIDGDKGNILFKW